MKEYANKSYEDNLLEQMLNQPQAENTITEFSPLLENILNKTIGDLSYAEILCASARV